MSKNRLAVTLACLMLLFSCFGESFNNSNRTEKSFVERWGNEDFSPFLHHPISLRGYDTDGDPIILAYTDSLKSETCQFPYKIVIKQGDGEIKSAERSFWDSTKACPIDEVQLKKLALQFHKYNITFLEVDSLKNVFLKFDLKEGKPDFARYSQTLYVPAKGWKHVSGNWYRNDN